MRKIAYSAIGFLAALFFASTALSDPFPSTIRVTGVPGGNPVNINGAAVTSATYGQVLVSSTTATLVGGLSGRRSIVIQNNGPNAMRCGSDSSVTTSTGVEIGASGATLSLDISDVITIYCIAKTATQLTGAATNYFEIK